MKKCNIIDPDKPLTRIPRVGDPVRLFPSAFVLPGTKDGVKSYVGRVVYVNEAHRSYTVEANVFGYAVRETYKF